MKVDANMGLQVQAKNNQVTGEIKHAVSDSKKSNQVQASPPFLQTGPALPDEAYRGKSDNGKLEVITYSSNGKLNIPSRYAEHRELLERVINSTSKLYLHDTPAAADRIAEEYEKTSADINRQVPGLNNRHWGFSIDSSGSLVATGNLTQQQKQVVEKTLNANEELVKAAQDFKSHFLEGLEIERGKVGTSQYWGKYDVTEESFADIIDFKEMVTQSINDNAERERTGYILDKYTWTLNIADQFSARAEANFAKS
ncbi:hypothetical protein JL49_04335 [Pseudoalteromonas luteoviolacea]|nr:hypothetical protein JL49_04335 [Pseudoalteromonas luteoviolacea]